MTMATDAGFYMPEAPATVEETGVPADLILQLVVKTLHFSGDLTGTELASRLGVLFPVIEPSLDFLKKQRQVEIAGGGMVGAPSYRYRLTDAGHSRAALFFEQSQYVGQVPVPLDQYVAYMHDHGRDQSLVVTREAVRRAFSHLVLSDKMLDQLGPALAARHSLFVYGPPGNGKTVISQAVRNVLVGDIAIPYALVVDGHIIRVFDAVSHEPIETPESDGGMGLERAGSQPDNRWIRCRRPLVTAGGELTLDALELGYSPSTGMYRAPLHLVANGGVLVIDDFGRQHVSPRSLLNRWIVPLDRGIDYMTLHTGQKFSVPFECFVVFATNLRPNDLVDEAFLRRIQYKVQAESPTLAEFTQIFRNYCASQDLVFDPALVHDLIENELKPRHVAPRGCQPKNLIDHSLALASYLDQPRALTSELLSAACALYFIDDEEGDGAGGH
jgi:predicted ATPase with chaperone activity